MLMSESQMNEPPVEGVSASESGQVSETTDASESWQQVVQAALGLVLFIGAVAMMHYYSPKAAFADGSGNDLQKQVHQLTSEIEQLKQEQAVTAVVLCK